MRHSNLEPIAEAVWLYAHRQPVIRHEPRGELADPRSKCFVLVDLNCVPV
jgi:hypothetical protein